LTQTILSVFALAVTPQHPHRSNLESTLIALNCCLTLPLGPIVGIRCEPLRGEGYFDLDYPYLGARISDSATYPMIAMCHEIGHVLDCFYIGKKTYMSLAQDPLPIWKAWISCVETSNSHQKLLSERENAPFSSVRETCLYFLEPQEIFARFFAQYIAYVTHHTGLNQELQQLQKLVPSPQWQNEEFESMVKPFESILTHFGVNRLKFEGK
jgi:hypothetical protein